MARFVNVSSMDAVEEETQPSNPVAAPMMELPAGYRFCPKGYELCRYYLYDKVTTGCCRWENVIIDVDILAHQPWDLPGMESNENEGYYFYAREKKSKAAGAENTKNNERKLKCAENACWKVNGSDDVMEQGMLWGKRNNLNHCVGPNKKDKTDWLMQEFVLNPSLIAQAGCNNPDDIVLCRVYKKKKDSESKKVEVEVKVKRDGEDQVTCNGKSYRSRKSSKNVEVKIMPPFVISGSGQPVKRKRIDASSSSTARFPRTTIQESRTQPAAAVASTSSMTSSCFQPSAAASVSAQPYIQESYHPAATSLLVKSYNFQSAALSTFAGYPYTQETHSSELAAMKYNLQPLDSADQPYNIIRQTHLAATAQSTKNDCDQLPASSPSSIAPIDDDPNKLYYTEELTSSIQTFDKATWKMESDHLCFDPDSLLHWLDIN
ncbi:hypothetical protein SLEP1_g6418 [Rubroshorea leprosula]|uniref:NAC domain-containing protein n=1 Tax=Rubroshorea leprosula TaxID=152421 RepID=A0AAV5HZQ1_9ROSI|nr:hypothetical protein SLEP1_g6418 [Rubroshorea leprosula]